MNKKFTDLKDLVKVFSKPDGIKGVIAYTNDHYYVEEIYKSFLKHLQKRFSDIEEIHINGREDVLDSFHSEFSTIPMFNETRYIWVRHCDLLFDRIKESKKIMAKFTSDLSNLSDSVFLFLHFDEKKLSKNFKFLEETFYLFEPYAMREKDAVPYIMKKTEVAKFKIDRGAAVILSELCNWDHKFITESLNRLFLYKMSEKEIKEEDVIMAALDVQGNNYYPVLDLISEKKTALALQKILSQDKKNISMVYSGIMKLFIDAYRYAMLKKINTSNAIDIIEETSSAWSKKKSEERIRKVLRYFPMNKIEKIIQGFPEFDRKQKSNANLEEHLLIDFIYRLDL